MLNEKIVIDLNSTLESTRKEIVKKYGERLITTTTAETIITDILNNSKVLKRIEKIKNGEREMGEYFETTVSLASKNHDLSEVEYEYINFSALLKSIFDLK